MKSLVIDIRKGGFGDNWMRLAAFYSVAALHPKLSLRVIISEKLLRIAKHTFGDRIEFDIKEDARAVSYDSRGLRDLIPLIIKGRRFAAPYHRGGMLSKSRWTLKDRVNTSIFTLCDWLGFVHLTPWAAYSQYQGYVEAVTLAPFRRLTVAEYWAQAQADYPVIKAKLEGEVPCSPELVVSEDLHGVTLVFPTGTGRQFIPLWWARENLPDACYAFFCKDPDLRLFAEAGLRTVAFYAEPGDIIALARAAHWTLTTDSFPSHVLQYASERTTVLLTEHTRRSTVTACFGGKVIEATAPCHPCPHLERKGFPLCKAGHAECINWLSPYYTQAVKMSAASSFLL